MVINKKLVIKVDKNHKDNTVHITRLKLIQGPAVFDDLKRI